MKSIIMADKQKKEYIKPAQRVVKLDVCRVLAQSNPPVFYNPDPLQKANPVYDPL